MKKNWMRYAVYLAGIIILAMGVTLNTKTALGVSPIISIPFCLTQMTGISLGIMTFVFYCIFVFLQILLLRRNFKPIQLLQLFLSVISSFFISWFDQLLPMCTTVVGKTIGLVLAIVLTGFGAYLMVSMQLIPNPADGLANAIGMVLHKDFGFGKNVFDFSCIVVTVVISMIGNGRIIGIGIGTILSMVFIGRVIALCRIIFQSRIKISPKGACEKNSR